MNFSYERCDISRDGESFCFAEERDAFVKFAPGHRVAEERRIISEMPVLFHANSTINFRFLRARILCFFSFSRSSVPPVCAAVARREIHGMSPMVSQAIRFHFCASWRDARYDREIIYITLTDVSLLSRYLDGHYETA